jgi:hypothetical protein
MVAWCASRRAFSPSPGNTIFTPAPAPGAASKKGSVENGGLAYLHSSFSPLRSFTDLAR